MLSQLRAVRRSKRPDFSNAGGWGWGPAASARMMSAGAPGAALCAPRTGLWVNLCYPNVSVSIKLKLSNFIFPASGPDRLSAEGSLLIGLVGSFPKVLVNSRSKSVFATSTLSPATSSTG